MTSSAERRVAEAIIELAQKQQDYDAWLSDLRTLEERLGSESVLDVLEHPDVPFAEKRRLIDRLVGGDVRPEGLHVAYYLVTKEHIRRLTGVLHAFQDLVNDVRHIRVADVVTARPLEPDQEAALRAVLGRRFGAGVELRQRVDPTIIGGVVIRVGDLLLDGSVQGRLDALREQLLRATR